MFSATSDGRADTFCAATVKSGIATGTTEAEAKTAATTWWSSRAGALGEGYQVWDRAKDKSLSCDPGPSGTFRCKASARPCLPDGKLPDDPQKRDL
ncbi:hypothetical protein [Hyphomicrobium sp.]|jgi:hypothetical protein|uniref:hypothetical protein n=1 Tax=Hyphomicrobium sp. TaxID=82 RepID=UPI0035683BE3